MFNEYLCPNGQFDFFKSTFYNASTSKKDFS